MRLKKWSDDNLREAAKSNATFKDMMISLGLKPGGGNESAVRARLRELGVDTSHFQRGGKGKFKWDTEELFRDGIMFHTGHRRHYLKLHEYRCGECGISEWAGKPITLQLDHVDGNRFNNVLDNLRLLCPNCHSQTETWGSKNKRPCAM